MPRPGDRKEGLEGAGAPLRQCAELACGAAAALVVSAGPVLARAPGVDAPDGGAPMYYLRTFGAPGDALTGILWGSIWLSAAVVVIVTALVIGGIALRSRRVADMRADAWSVSRSHDHRALRWIYGGVVVTVGALAFFITWTVGTMAAIRAPDETPALSIEVTGHQWWWEVAYLDADGGTIFETANEIHVPAGRAVKFLLRSPDVIHSFWVPLLAGKTDLVPGQVNTTWLRADRPGVYRGQCLEYCGRQHAHMSFLLFADPPGEFDAWLASQPGQAGRGAPPDAGVPAPAAQSRAAP